MIRTITLSMMAAFWAASAFAGQCPSGKDTVLHCDIGSKRLDVCIGQGAASYAFGPRGAPELAFTQQLDTVRGTAWSGVGRSIGEEIIFSNNGVSYAVWHSVDRSDENRAASGGVAVQKNGKTLADLTCKAGSADVSIFAISDGFARAGYCWNRADQRFQRGGCH